MSVAVLCASHTPLKYEREPAAGVRAELDTVFDALREFLRAYDPELVVVFGPDHFNGFFYRLMPAFCVAAAARSVGDWRTPLGTLPCDPALAGRAVRHLHACGVDAALSHRMEADHGITQLLDEVFEWSALPTVLPVFVNCAAPPLPPLARVVALGDALGGFLAGLGRRVLVAASGGLSHDPPIPALEGAPAPVRERLIAGGTLDSEARAARQARVLADADAQAAGTSGQRPLNPAWDERVLERVAALDLEALAGMDDEAITRDAGCGGHEVRTWVAAAAAARAAGFGALDVRYYRAIPEWIAGFGVVTGGALA